MLNVRHSLPYLSSSFLDQALVFSAMSKMLLSTLTLAVSAFAVTGLFYSTNCNLVTAFAAWSNVPINSCYKNKTKNFFDWLSRLILLASLPYLLHTFRTLLGPCRCLTCMAGSFLPPTAIARRLSSMKILSFFRQVHKMSLVYLGSTFVSARSPTTATYR